MFNLCAFRTYCRSCIGEKVKGSHPEDIFISILTQGKKKIFPDLTPALSAMNKLVGSDLIGK